MAVIEVVENGGTTVLATTGVTSLTEIPTETAVIEVLAGLPGVQNVYVGTTPPANPQENWLWIDTNG